MHIFSYDRL